jgi:hypothetical protein
MYEKTVNHYLTVFTARKASDIVALKQASVDEPLGDIHKGQLDAGSSGSVHEGQESVAIRTVPPYIDFLNIILEAGC